MIEFIVLEEQKKKQEQTAKKRVREKQEEEEEQRKQKREKNEKSALAAEASAASVIASETKTPQYKRSHWTKINTNAFLGRRRCGLFNTEAKYGSTNATSCF